MILFFNFLLYFSFFIYKFKKRDNYINIYNYIILLYSIIALLGYIIFENGIYEYTFGYKNEESLSIIPYILTFISFIIIIYPLKRSNLFALNSGISNNNLDTKIIYFTLIVFIIYLLLFNKLISYRSSLTDFGDIYNDAAAGNTISFGNSTLDFIYSKILTLTHILPYITYPLLFKKLVIGEKRRFYFFIIFILFSMQIYPLINNANRGGVFFTTMLFISYYIFYRKNINKKIKKYFFILGIAGLVVISLYSLTISYSRTQAEKSEAINTMVFRYFGEPFPNLGFNIWNHNINHPYGKRFFPNLTQAYKNYDIEKGRNSKFIYWERFVGIPMLNFKTFFGDVYVEFGLIFGFLFIIGITLVCNKLLNNTRNYLYNHSLIFFYINTCVYGLFSCYWGSEESWKELIYLFILSKIFIYLSNKKLK